MELKARIGKLKKRKQKRLELFGPQLSHFKNCKLMKIFEKEKAFLLFGNFYPMEKIQIVPLLVGTFMLIYSSCGLYSMLAAAYLAREDLAKVSEILLFCMTVVAYFLKVANFIPRRRNLLVIEEYLKDPVLNNFNKEQAEVFDSYIIPFQRFTTIFRGLAFSCVIFYGVFPYIDNDPDHLIPLPGWFPFDIPSHRLLITFLQQLYVTITAFNNSNLDISMMMLVTFGSLHFDILKNNLESITKFEGSIDNSVVKERIKMCVIQHTTLLEYVSVIESIYSSGVFFQFLITAIVLCMTVFQMAMISVKSIQFVLLIAYLGTILCQAALYCWYGNEIMHNSSGIGEACYMSKWDQCDPSIVRLLLFIMEKAKVSVTVTAASLFPLTLATLMAILRTSYSYFALLQSIYKDDE